LFELLEYLLRAVRLQDLVALTFHETAQESNDGRLVVGNQNPGRGAERTGSGGSRR
jgi:hypothetical protein